MDQQELQDRTRLFGLRIVRLVSMLSNDRVSDLIARQVLKSGTSIGANYREAIRASSRKHFLSIVEIVLREADETLYWLEILDELQLAQPATLKHLLTECNELVAIFCATIKTIKRNP